jgi:hypothetical protein
MRLNFGRRSRLLLFMFIFYVIFSIIMWYGDDDSPNARAALAENKRQRQRREDSWFEKWLQRTLLSDTKLPELGNSNIAQNITQISYHLKRLNPVGEISSNRTAQFVIGIPTVKRKGIEYLTSTLTSLFEAMNDNEKEQVIVIIAVVEVGLKLEINFIIILIFFCFL